MSLARCSSVNGANGEFMSAFLPDFTVAVATPSLSMVPSTTILPPKMPIDPVSVPGCATIAWAGIEM